MNQFPTKRVRQSLFTGLKYEHVYTPEEQKEYYTRVADGENAWILITED